MSNDLNKWIVIGRLTRDVGSDPNGRDFGYLQNGTCKAVISIASNRSKKQSDGSYADEVSYFNINVWGKMAENLKPYLLKGTQVMVEAVLKQDRWQDKQTGENKSQIAIHAENVQLLGSKRDNSSQQFNNQNGYQQPQNQQYNGYAPNITTAGNVPPQNNQQSFGQNQQPLNNGINDSSYSGDFPEDIIF